MISLLIAIIYLCFISLGLPDSLLGSAWPIMYQEFNIPISYQGFVSITISVCTIISSLLSDTLTKKIKPFNVIVLSITLTSLGLFGFSISDKFYMLIIFGIPYGLGAGSIDACLNNYVALHFESKHMSWLHCMWGIGASISPYIMAYALTRFGEWNKGYLIVSIIQAIITLIILLSFKVWKRNDNKEDIESNNTTKSLSIKEILSIKGAKACFIMFFCYCSFECTSFLWASSYLRIHSKVSEVVAANLACLFYIGMTVGRFINGFLTMKISDNKLIRIGSIIVFIGASILFIPVQMCSFIGLVIMGLGCAPIYPCIIHMTPKIFGSDKSQAMIGVQMACAYTGSSFMPPIFGLIANHISISLYPLWVLVLLSIMITMHEILKRKTSN